MLFNNHKALACFTIHMFLNEERYIINTNFTYHIMEPIPTDDLQECTNWYFTNTAKERYLNPKLSHIKYTASKTLLDAHAENI